MNPLPSFFLGPNIVAIVILEGYKVAKKSGLLFSTFHILKCSLPEMSFIGCHLFIYPTKMW